MTTRALVIGVLIGVSHAVLAAQERAPEPSSSTPIPSPQINAETKFVWKEYPSLRSGRFRIDFRARFSGDRRWSESLADNQTRSMIASTSRAGASALPDRSGDVIEFQVERELANDVPWRDVYIDVRPKREIGVQAGKFKMPFSLDENTSATNLDFVYRSLAASTLSPGRDRGVMVHGRVRGRLVGYEAGVFLHDGDNALANDPEEVQGDRTAAVRVTFEPISARKKRMDDLRVGIAWTGSDVPVGQSAITGDTALHSHFFPSNLWCRARAGGSEESCSGARDRFH
jgi:phosphate-selective porin